MYLFKDRTLNIAILISVLWHFAIIFSIKPVLSTGYIVKHNTSIAFLGDILENIGNYITEDSKDQEKSVVIFRPRHIFIENKIVKSEPIIPSFINILPEKKEFLYSPDDRNFLMLNGYRKKEVAKVNFSDFFIKGDARDRVIIYKPDLDRITVLPSDFNSDFIANIKFRISKDGFVKYAECATSSGFSEIDQAAIRYIKKWQFVPTGEDDQEGIVRVSFK